jgi:hypothetical protein
MLIVQPLKWGMTLLKILQLLSMNRRCSPLGNTYSEAELLEFDTRVRKELGDHLNTLVN